MIKDMFKSSFLVVYITLYCIVGFVSSYSYKNTYYGIPCKYDIECRKFDFYKELCVNGKCQCGSEGLRIYTRYDKNSNPICDYDMNLSIHKKKSCIDGKDENKIWYEDDCHCRDGFFYSTKSGCVKGKYVGPRETCGSYDIMKVCDYRNMTYCSTRNYKCACFKGYYHDLDTELCLEKSVYLTKFSIGVYKAQVLDYCEYDKDCLDGLVCDLQRFSCQCPRLCSYEVENKRCFCGVVSIYTPMSVIITGVILSLLSFIFWGCCICCTLVGDVEEENVDISLNPPQAESLPLNPPVLNTELDQLDADVDRPPPYDELFPPKVDQLISPSKNDENLPTYSLNAVKVSTQIDIDDSLRVDDPSAPYPVDPPSYNPYPVNPAVLTPMLPSQSSNTDFNPESLNTPSLSRSFTPSCPNLTELVPSRYDTSTEFSFQPLKTAFSYRTVNP